MAPIQILNTGCIGSHRPLALIVGAHRVGHQRQDTGLHLLLARKVLRRRYERRLGGVLETGLVDMEGSGHGGRSAGRAGWRWSGV